MEAMRTTVVIDSDVAADANLLLYAVDEDSADNTAAASWLQEVLDGRSGCATRRSCDRTWGRNRLCRHRLHAVPRAPLG
jgi:hypothetical protein